MGIALGILLLLPASMQGAKALEHLNHKMALKEMERVERIEVPETKRLKMGDVFGYSKPQKKTLRGR